MADLFSDLEQVQNAKEIELISLRKDVEEIKSQLKESYVKKAARDKVLAELTNVLDGMIDLYPSFVPKTLNYDKKEAYLLGRETMVNTAIMKGEKNIADIVAYVDQYNNYSGRRSLKLILAELKKTTIEEICHEKKTTTRTDCIGNQVTVFLGNKNPSTIQFQGLNQILKTPLNSLIKDTIEIGYKIDGRIELPKSNFQFHCEDDNNNYSLQEDFVRIWGLKQQFARESLRAISSYVNNLIIINEYSTGKPVCKEICRNCEANHNIRDCTKECNGSCPRSYKSHVPKDCPARLLSEDL